MRPEDRRIVGLSNSRYLKGILTGLLGGIYKSSVQGGIRLSKYGDKYLTWGYKKLEV